MVSLRDRVVAIFEKHRIAPETPYEKDHVLDFLLPHREKTSALYDSFRGLRRFNAFIDEIQDEFAICFSMKDRDANYSKDSGFDESRSLRHGSSSPSIAAIFSHVRPASIRHDNCSPDRKG
jgi:hypothetical protein